MWVGGSFPRATDFIVLTVFALSPLMASFRFFASSAMAGLVVPQALSGMGGTQTRTLALAIFNLFNFPFFPSRPTIWFARALAQQHT